MPKRTETIHPTVTQLVTGHYPRETRMTTWREHGTTDWLLIYTLHGGGRFGYEGGQIIAQAGDMTLLRPGTRHDYGVAAEWGLWDLLWAHFHPLPHWHAWLDWPEEAPGLMRLSLAPTETRDRIVQRFFECHRLAGGALRRREPFAMNALEEVLLWCDTQNPYAEQIHFDARVRQALDYICLNLHQEITLASLADVTGLSASRLSHLFQEQLGMSALAFLELRRLNRAKQLLELTSRAVHEIAQEVGFANPFYFSLRFKRQTGLSPRAYRQQALAAAERREAHRLAGP